MRKTLAALGMSVVMSLSWAQDRIITESTSNSSVTSSSTTQSETTVKSPPPSAISPGITVINNDLCTVGVSGAVQTQILGISGGSTVRDMNCERIKLAKNLFDMGMKVAAVATLCQDERVFAAMQNAGTPCPIDGKIGNEAAALWAANPQRVPGAVVESGNENLTIRNSWFIGIAVLLLILL